MKDRDIVRPLVLIALFIFTIREIVSCEKDGHRAICSPHCESLTP